MIGGLEEMRKMTNKEAIEIIKIAIAEVEWDYPMDYTVAFEKAIEALEKQEPMEAIERFCGDGWNDYFKGECPRCGKTIEAVKRCPHCDQIIRWVEE